MPSSSLFWVPSTIVCHNRVVANLIGAYCASKFAMEAVTDALRQELFSLGISVSAVEPGFMKTPLVENSALQIEAIWEGLMPNVRMHFHHFL